MTHKILLPSLLFVTFTLIACESSGGGSTTKGAGGSGSTSSSATSGGKGGSGGDATPADSCVKPGDKGNANGVGDYCSPGGQQCANLMYATACLADLGVHQWFCTHIGCKANAECGAAAHCDMESAGSACVPDKCGGASDAGTDASPDGGK